jgi:hypothetical protein
MDNWTTRESKLQKSRRKPRDQTPGPSLGAQGLDPNSSLDGGEHRVGQDHRDNENADLLLLTHLAMLFILCLYLTNQSTW